MDLWLGALLVSRTDPTNQTTEKHLKHLWGRGGRIEAKIGAPHQILSVSPVDFRLLVSTNASALSSLKRGKISTSPKQWGLFLHLKDLNVA